MCTLYTVIYTIYCTLHSIRYVGYIVHTYDYAPAYSRVLRNSWCIFSVWRLGMCTSLFTHCLVLMINACIHCILHMHLSLTLYVVHCTHTNVVVVKSGPKWTMTYLTESIANLSTAKYRVLSETWGEKLNSTPISIALLLPPLHLAHLTRL